MGYVKSTSSLVVCIGSFGLAGCGAASEQNDAGELIVDNAPAIVTNSSGATFRRAD